MSTILQNRTKRPIDLSVYVGDDPCFKKELISMMILNIRDLQRAIREFRDPVDLRATFHQVKPTISMLDDEDLMTELSSLTRMDFNDPDFKIKCGGASYLCDQAIESLDEELLKGN